LLGGRKAPTYSFTNHQPFQLMQYFLNALKTKYADFNGRARRAEFWQFLLFAFVVIPFGLSMIIGLLATLLKMPMLYGLQFLYYLAVLVPYIAVGVRRMHDVGKPFWYIFIPIYNLILYCTEGTPGPNEYGPDPKASNVATTGFSSASSTY
jgi:uncharacterized membrane protein YhaH (DUF805 family)